MNEQQPPDEAQAEVALKRANAIREAMMEVMGEHRAEIIRRARAKLVAQGVPVADGDGDEAPL